MVQRLGKSFVLIWKTSSYVRMADIFWWEELSQLTCPIDALFALFIHIIDTTVFTPLNLDKYFRRIGIEANEELRSIFKRNVHLILQVRVAKRRSAWTECECIHIALTALQYSVSSACLQHFWKCFKIPKLWFTFFKNLSKLLTLISWTSIGVLSKGIMFDFVQLWCLYRLLPIWELHCNAGLSAVVEILLVGWSLDKLGPLTTSGRISAPMRAPKYAPTCRLSDDYDDDKLAQQHFGWCGGYRKMACKVAKLQRTQQEMLCLLYRYICTRLPIHILVSSRFRELHPTLYSW
jgi:hypothetical protein